MKIAIEALQLSDNHIESYMNSHNKRIIRREKNGTKVRKEQTKTKMVHNVETILSVNPIYSTLYPFILFY